MTDFKKITTAALCDQAGAIVGLVGEDGKEYLFATAQQATVPALYKPDTILVATQALSANHTIIAADMGTLLTCVGPMTVTFPAASSIGAFAVPVVVANINLPNVTIAGLPALTNVLEFGQVEMFLSDGSNWRRMVGDSNSRVDKLRGTLNAAGTVVLTTDLLTPVALNQITPPANSAFEFAGRVLARAVSTTTQNQKSALWKIEGSGYVDATAGSLVIFAVTITNPTSNTGWSVAVAADTTNGSVQVSFTGDQAAHIVAEVGTVMLT